MSGTTGFNNGYAFTITDPSIDQTNLTNSFGSLMADPTGTPPSTSGSFLGLTGNQWAGGLKDIAGSLKGAGTGLSSAGAPSRTGLPSAAGAHPGTAGSLGTLLQLLAQRANMFSQAAHQGAVPASTRGSQGLLGL